MSDTTVRAEGLLVKINPGLEAPTLKSLKSRLGSDMRSKRLSQELLWHHVTSKKAMDKNAGRVFDIAHDLLDIPGVLSVEPNLVITEKRELKFEEEKLDPKTNGQYTWHIEKVNAGDARRNFSVTGEGVRVAHLDTGYTKHPELVIGTAVRADLGCNFYEKTTDPLEPLKTIDEGHGTATASVLVGLPGKQHSEGDPAYVEGVALGAELVPIRVDKNVWWTKWNPAKDVPGIDHALKQECHVISMSRGGPNYDSLRDAVKLAIARGTIVVAAASNCNVGCGIWSPANYPEVVCAAGSTFDMSFWEDSSRGPEVTIAAPAWSVYRARTVKKNNDYAFTVERGHGTSYATPIVAGAAALWIQRHGGAVALAGKLKGWNRIPVVFKDLLGKTAQPGKDWDTAKFGPGILDCLGLLRADLPKPEDIPTIEDKLRTEANASRRQIAEWVLSDRIGEEVDPRSRHLYSLELEGEAMRLSEVGSLLEAGTKELAKDQLDSESFVKTLREDPSISKSLRRVFEP